jgi:hypothetical protein
MNDNEKARVKRLAWQILCGLAVLLEWICHRLSMFHLWLWGQTGKLADAARAKRAAAIAKTAPPDKTDAESAEGAP